jgi:HlyD family secretion protein
LSKSAEERDRKLEGRKMKKLITVAVAVIVVGVGAILLNSVNSTNEGNQFELAEVTKGDIENLVTCTGTLSAVGTVEIGTQVSGTVAEVHADFNDEVRAGTILAVLDTTMLKASVMDARAGLLSARAQYDLAVAEYEQNLPLAEKGFISDKEFLPYEYAVRTREAQVKSAEAILERAEANLGYAVITSPIDGTVIQRTVEPGQTVAASLSTPVLFVIAADLSEMEIHAQVDESDIGQIEVGQEVRFTVQAYPDDTFEGVVRQVRLQPETLQNVVNYTVVVDAPNESARLLPGMTATVDFIVEQRKDVLLVPNTALRITPTEEMVAAARKQMEERRGAQPGPAGEAGEHSTTSSQGQMVNRGSMPLMPFGGESDRKVVWYMDDSGSIRLEPVRTGATDGKFTEIVASRLVGPGTQVIKSLTAAGQAAAESGSSGSAGRPPGFRMF